MLHPWMEALRGLRSLWWSSISLYLYINALKLKLYFLQS